MNLEIKLDLLSLVMAVTSIGLAIGVFVGIFPTWFGFITLVLGIGSLILIKLSRKIAKNHEKNRV